MHIYIYIYIHVYIYIYLYICEQMFAHVCICELSCAYALICAHMGTGPKCRTVLIWALGLQKCCTVGECGRALVQIVELLSYEGASVVLLKNLGGHCSRIPLVHAARAGFRNHQACLN